MRERLLEGVGKDNPENLPWFQAETGRFLKAEGGGDDGVYSFTISTPTVDRYEDIVRSEGMDNTAFRENAVVPWAHSNELLPLGESLREEVIDKNVRVDADMVFDTVNDPSGFAAAVKGKVDRRSISATSIRFNPLKYEALYELIELENGGEEEWWTGGFDFKEWELLEWSLVVVPANPDTVRRAYGVLRNGPTSDLDEDIRKALEKAVNGRLEKLECQILKLKKLADLIERDPSGAVRAQIEHDVDIRGACDVLRDLPSQIGG